MAASFQRAVVDVLVRRTVKRLPQGGGEHGAGHRRRGLQRPAARASSSRPRRAEGLTVYIPSPQYTTDNAAMIAAAGFLHFEAGRFAGLDLNADAALRL